MGITADILVVGDLGAWQQTAGLILARRRAVHTITVQAAARAILTVLRRSFRQTAGMPLGSRPLQ